MNVSQVNIQTPGTNAAALLKPDAERFSRHIDAAVADAGAAGDDRERTKTLRKASEQLVATTFILPMLSKMRDDPFKSDLFHGGQTEQIFGQQLDTILAERIVAKTDFSIVDAVYRSIAERASMPTDDPQGVDTHG
jgi:Rod binding domain-containing protein